jgi:hypothetical protein
MNNSAIIIRFKYGTVRVFEKQETGVITQKMSSTYKKKGISTYRIFPFFHWNLAHKKIFINLYE